MFLNTDCSAVQNKVFRGSSLGSNSANYFRMSRTRHIFNLKKLNHRLKLYCMKLWVLIINEEFGAFLGFFLWSALWINNEIATEGWSCHRNNFPPSEVNNIRKGKESVPHKISKLAWHRVTKLRLSKTIFCMMRNLGPASFPERKASQKSAPNHKGATTFKV